MRRFFTPGWLLSHVLVVAAVVVCLRLAWWQLDRSEAVDGSAQNLGYALLWPAFAVAFVYMWVRFIRLEIARDAEIDRQAADQSGRVIDAAETIAADAAGTIAAGAAGTIAADAAGTIAADAARASGTDTDAAAPADTVDPRPASARHDFVGIVGDEDDDDPELTAYNRALAALADKDRRAR